MPQLCAFPTSLLGLRFDGPVTVIAGENSDYVAQRDGASFRPMFTQLDVEVIEDAGHWVHADQPIAFLASVRRALQATRRSPVQKMRSRTRLPPLSDAGQDLGHADQGDGDRARPVARLFARRRRCLHGDRRRPARGRQPDRAQQPGGRHHQRHRGARPGQHRPARRQAGDGRQGVPVQEVRRHRRVRHRARRERPRQA